MSNPFVKKSSGQFDNYFKLNAKTAQILMSVKNGDNWESEEIGNLIEGDLKSVNIGSYTYEGDTHPTVEFEIWRLLHDGTVSKAKFTTSASSGLSILNTLASQDNLDGLSIGLEFYLKEYVNAKGTTKKGCQCAISVNGERGSKEDSKGIEWKFSADQIKPLFSAEGEKKVYMFKSFVENNLKPLFEKGPSEGSTDYSGAQRATEPIATEKTKTQQDMEVVDELLGDNDSDDLPF